MGSYVRNYLVRRLFVCVGRAEFELYAQHDKRGGVAGYELICGFTGRKINDGLLLEVPDQLDVEALVRERSVTVLVDMD